ncbi:MAG: glycosyltransferase family 4 protein [Magnetococcales bacterium]|nr:glycosyltransferase family 4 protein [Magnetococcales bacterium]
MSVLWIGGLALAALGIAWRVAHRLCDPASRFHLLDAPNHRSLHENPTPRGGGLGILLGFVLSWGVLWLLIEPAAGSWTFWPGVLAAAAVSFQDDRQSLSPGVRLLSQGLLVLFLGFGGFLLTGLDFPLFGHLSMGYVGWLFSALFVFWMVNLYNFMDGMDGFAAGMGLFGFGFLALHGWMGGALFFFATALLLASANLGFLLVNFPPARIFMGDVGSVSMGFMAAALSLWGVRDGLFPLWVPVLTFSPFIVDATLTLIRRVVRREKILQAHRSHFYQWLVQRGWGHRRTVLWEYTVMAAAGVSAWWMVHRSEEMVQALGLVGWSLGYLGLYLGRYVVERRG